MKIENNRQHLIQLGAIKLAPGENEVQAQAWAGARTAYAQGIARMIEAGWITENVERREAKPVQKPEKKGTAAMTAAELLGAVNLAGKSEK